MKQWLFLSIVFSSIILSFGTGEEGGQTIDSLIQKICSVAKDKLKIHTLDPENRKKVLEAMKAKLNKASQQLGLQMTAHVRLIIQGVAILALEENYQKLCNKDAPPTDRRAFFKHMHAITVNTDRPDSRDNSTVTVPSRKTNNKILEIRSLVDKMESIMRRTIKTNSTIKEQLKTAEKLKSQFIAAFKRAYSNSSDLDTYIGLVRQGMDLVVGRVLNNPRRMEEVPHKAKADGAIQLPSKSQLISGGKVNAQVTRSPPPIAGLVYSTKPSSSVISTPPQDITTTTEYFRGITKDFSCNDVLNMTCTSLKSLDKLICEYDGTTLTMQQICDGNIDCPDASDEKNCIQQVIAKIHSATQVMAKVESSRPCFKTLVDNTLLSEQGEILAGLLNKQVAFLKKYPQMKSELSTGLPAEKKITRQYQLQQSINEIAYEVAVIVRSFASTLMGALCRNDEHLDQLIGLEGPEPAAPAEKDISKVNIKNRRMWLPSVCKCNKQYCEKANACDPQCKRFCYQIYTLENFVCPSVLPGQSAVPLDLVCDGKFDCFDETDERNCPGSRNAPMTKTLLSELFENTINLVKARIMREGWDPARVDMVELQTCISNLQRRALVYKFDIDNLKMTRDKCFKHLRDIYEVMLEDGKLKGEDQEALYDFLMSVNEQLISALKHTHTGNTHTLSTDDCYCRDGKCVQVECTASCERICPVKLVLTNYMCNGTNTSIVPIDAICDGKINCPNAEDELDCKKEICRMHHINVIYSTIDEVDLKYRGTPVGDVLGKWKTKMTSRLVVLENQGRITPWLYKTTLSDLLKDLALIYSSIENYYHHEADSRLKKFSKLAQILMEKAKDCNM